MPAISLQMTETLDLVGRQRDADRVVGRAGLLVMGHVRRDPRHGAMQFRNRAGIGGMHAHRRLLADDDLVDIRGMDAGLEIELVVRRAR